MASSRRSLVSGGFLGGLALGVLTGAAESWAFLRPHNWSTTPGRAALFVVGAAAVYALVFAAAGSVLALLLRPSVRRARAGAGAEVAHGLSFSVSVIGGLAVFAIGAWRLRMAPPDFAVFRLYCLPETAIVLLVAVLAGVVAYLVASRAARFRPVERLLASSRATAGGCVVAAVLATILTTGLNGTAPAAPQPAAGAPPNVLLFTIDTLRANHVGPWGSRRPTSPVVSDLASRSVVFTQAIVQYPLTTPSHASILTSRYPRSHGATDNAVPIDESVILLSEVLKEHGYSTAGFVTAGFVGARYGFARGFDHFVEMNAGDFRTSSLIEWLEQLRIWRILWRWRSLDASTAAVERWIVRERSVPFFVWVHQYAPHTPYSPPFRYERKWDTVQSRLIPTVKRLSEVNDGTRAMSAEDRAHAVSLYDAEIEYADRMMGGVLDALDRSGQAGNTLIVFTADHGECLYDRQSYWGHGDRLYDEEVVVPLLFSAPWAIESGTSVDVQVESIDIAPTILDFLGLTPNDSFQGESLLRLLTRPARRSGSAAREPGPPAFSIVSGSRMIRQAGWKYIEHDDPALEAELYDLESDPGETVDLIRQAPDRARALAGVLEDWEAIVPSVRSEAPARDEDALKALRALGYLD
jgi:arylsulfatase A-like enzyme